jgi:hypothetical protein
VATISKRDETLVIELSALEKSEAMHGDLEIPTAAISSVEVLDDAIHQIHGLRPSGLKITGTYLPGKMAMGTYLAGLHHRPVFAVIHRDTTRGVRIQLEDWKFSQVIFGCKDPEALQAEIARA